MRRTPKDSKNRFGIENRWSMVSQKIVKTENRLIRFKTQIPNFTNENRLASWFSNQNLMNKNRYFTG
jgi:hypothetical protein